MLWGDLATSVCSWAWAVGRQGLRAQEKGEGGSEWSWLGGRVHKWGPSPQNAGGSGGARWPRDEPSPATHRLCVLG